MQDTGMRSGADSKRTDETLRQVVYFYDCFTMIPSALKPNYLQNATSTDAEATSKSTWIVTGGIIQHTSCNIHKCVVESLQYVG
jgi:hypothetical protein